MEKNTELISEIVSFHSAVLPKFQDIWKRAKENIGIYGINHWNDSDKAKFKAAGRVELNVPILTQKVNSLLGFEQQNRTEPNYIGVGEEDELNGEILTKLVRWTENANTPKYKFVKSDIFKDGIIPCYGALHIFTEEDYTGRTLVRFKRIPYNNVVWDTNFTDFELDTCSRMQTVRWVYVDQLMREYPSKKSELESTTVAGYSLDNADYLPVKELDNYYTNIQEINGKQKYLCKEITDYKKINRTTYEVIKVNLDLAGDDKYCFETKKEAQEFVNLTLSQLGVPQENYGKAYIIKPVTKARIQKTVITGEMVLLEPEIMEDEEFPIKILFTYFFDGEFWTPVDVAKDPQHYVDKVFAQIDKSVSEGVKSGKVLYPNYLHPDMTPEEADAKLTKGETIYGLDPANKPFEIINAPPMLGGYFEIIQFNQSILESLHGGQTFQGIADSKNQSGVAIQSLQNAGAQMSLNFLENLQRFEDAVAKYVLKLILRYYNQETKLRIIGDEFSEKVMKAIEASPFYKKSALGTGIGFLTVNSKGQKSLDDSVYDIAIKPISSKANEKDVKFQKLMAYAQYTGQPIPPKMVGRMLDLDPTEIDELQRYADEAQAQAQKQQQLQNNLEIAKTAQPDSNLLMAMGNLNQNNQNGKT